MTPQLRALALSSIDKVKLAQSGLLTYAPAQSAEEIAKYERYKSYYRVKNAEYRKRNLAKGLYAHGQQRTKTKEPSHEK